MTHVSCMCYDTCVTPAAHHPRGRVGTSQMQRVCNQITLRIMTVACVHTAWADPLGNRRHRHCLQPTPPAPAAAAPLLWISVMGQEGKGGEVGGHHPLLLLCCTAVHIGCLHPETQPLPSCQDSSLLPSTCLSAVFSIHRGYNTGLLTHRLPGSDQRA